MINTNDEELDQKMQDLVDIENGNNDEHLNGDLNHKSDIVISDDNSTNNKKNYDFDVSSSNMKKQLFEDSYIRDDEKNILQFVSLFILMIINLI